MNREITIPVVFLNFNGEAPARGYWGQHLLEAIFRNKQFRVVDDILIKAEDSSFGIVVIPGGQNVDNVDQINEYLTRFSGVVVIVTGDEESKFPLEGLAHPNMKLWAMTPHPGKSYANVDRFIGFGIPPHFEKLPKEKPEKTTKWFFAGQVTHSRRIKCVNELQKLDDGKLIESPGFAQGIDPLEYVDQMASAKIIPCPGGPMTPDTFRLYEALEAGCIPIADEISAVNKNPGYWNMIFGEEFPFPTIRDWRELPELISYYNDVFPRRSNQIFAWWQMYKRNLKLDLMKDVASTMGVKLDPSGITVIIPTSPTINNPDTSIIEETISTVRAHLPYAEIIVTFDGVRPEQEHLREVYEEYTAKLLWKMNKEWERITPMVFTEHMHQVAMCRAALEHVHTDQILYVEQDTPLTPDMAIEWAELYEIIRKGDANMIRFHFEAFIPQEHKELMLDKEPVTINGVKMVRTIQWSQRPHLANADFYRKILNQYFSPEAKSFIEDKMHGVVIGAYKMQQKQGWNEFKVWIYHPDGNIKRSYHLDGRGEEQKYDMKF